MSNLLKWYAVDKEYVEYLRRYDSRVQYIDYNIKFKPYIGIILNISNFDYYVPISSVGERKEKLDKYLNMKEDIDLLKIIDKDQKLLAVLNLNNMIPVDFDNVEQINYNDIGKYRKFNSVGSKKRYIYLLQIELSYLRKNVENILKKSIKLYNYKINKPLSKISSRTCNFKKLEEKCIEYKKVQEMLPKLNCISNKEDLYYIYDNLENKESFEKVLNLLDNKNKISKICEISKKEINDLASS